MRAHPPLATIKRRSQTSGEAGGDFRTLNTTAVAHVDRLEYPERKMDQNSRAHGKTVSRLQSRRRSAVIFIYPLVSSSFHLSPS